MGPSSTLRAAQPARICIVDETVIDVALLRSLFEPRGHTVIPMTSPEDAIKEVIRKPPDLLLIEIGMSEMDGFTLLEQMRSKGLSDGTRVVFMTSRPAPADRQRAQDLGAFDVISKPFDTNKTLHHIESIIAGGAATTPGFDGWTPLNEHMLAVLESGSRLSIPDDVLAARAAERSTVEDILKLVTARVSGRARDRGVDLHVEQGPSTELRGNKELIVRAWTQVLEAAIMRAEPGSAVVILLEPGPRGMVLRFKMSCDSGAASRMMQLAGAGQAPVRVERRKGGGIDLVIELQQDR